MSTAVFTNLRPPRSQIELSSEYQFQSRFRPHFGLDLIHNWSTFIPSLVQSWSQFILILIKTCFSFSAYKVQVQFRCPPGLVRFDQSQVTLQCLNLSCLNPVLLQFQPQFFPLQIQFYPRFQPSFQSDFSLGYSFPKRTNTVQRKARGLNDF